LQHILEIYVSSLIYKVWAINPSTLVYDKVCDFWTISSEPADGVRIPHVTYTLSDAVKRAKIWRGVNAPHN